MMGERVKVSECRTLREIKAGAWRGKGGLHREGRQIQRRTGRQARRATLGKIEGSMSG